MAYIYFNPNPKGKHVGDCTVRALCKAMDCTWETAYISLCAEGMDLRDMPSANHVMRAYLLKNGYRQYLISSDCPDCVTVGEFAEMNPRGTFILTTDNHVVCVQDGDVYDSWNSLDEPISFYYAKEG